MLRHQHTHEELVRLTFDEVRRAAAGQPTVSIYLLAALALLHESMRAAGLHDRLEPLSAQARLVVSGCQAAGKSVILFRSRRSGQDHDHPSARSRRLPPRPQRRLHEDIPRPRRPRPRHADRTWGARVKKLARPERLILDGFAMRDFTAAQADDLYE